MEIGKGSRFFNSYVDLTWCPNCKNGMLKHLKTKQSNSKVIFVSCVMILKKSLKK